MMGCMADYSEEDLRLIKSVTEELEKKLRKAKQEVNDLLLDVLNQACGDGKGKIDNMCLSAYEDACDYLKKEGLLEEVNSRIFNIKQ